MKHEMAARRLERWLDGELAAPEREALTLHLIGCPACQARLGDLVSLRRVVRARLATAAEPPPGLAERVTRQWAIPVPAPPSARGAASPPPARSWWRGVPLRAGIIALGTVALVVIALGGNRILPADRAVLPEADVAGQMATHHRLFGNDDKALEVEGGSPTVAAWFADRLTFPVVAPAIPGYELLGGRLIALDGHRAAQLVYENEPTEQYVSLFLAPRSDVALPALRLAGEYGVGRRGDLTVVLKPLGALNLALVAPLQEATLVELAGQLAYPRGSLGTDRAGGLPSRPPATMGRE